MLKLCIQYVYRKALFLLYLVLNLAMGIVALALPWLIGLIVNSLIAPPSDARGILALCIGVGAFGTAGTFFQYASTMLYTDLQSHAGFELNADVIEHVKRLPQSFFVHFDAAYYNQQINHDANNLVIFAINSVAQIGTNVLIFFGTLALLFTLSPVLAAVCLVLGTAGSFLYFAFRKRMYTRNFEFQERQAKFFSALQDQLENIGFIRRHVLFKQFKAMLIRAFNGLYPALVDSQRVNARFELSKDVISAFAQAALLAIGACEVVSGNLLPGYLITVVNYYSSLSSAVQYLLTWGKSYQDARVSYERLKRIIDIPEERNGAIDAGNVNVIECKDVSFSYPGEEREALCKTQASFHSGKMYGISGRNGGGKSTLLNILLGMYPDDINGSVLYDGVNQRDIDRMLLRSSHVGITEQNPFILNDTVRVNLSLLNESCDEEKLDEYVDALDLRSLIEALPKGMDTVLDGKVQDLSGGERQKIAIIRQLVQNPEVMLFDEPTSALDAKSREALVRILRSKRLDHLIIVVTHDKDMLEACDEVITISPTSD